MDFKEHILDYRVPFNFIDIGGVIYNARYPDVFNYARDEYMREIGFPYSKLMKKEKKHLAVVEINIKYRLPVFYDEEVKIVTKVEKTSSKSVVFSQKILKADMKTICTQSTTATVCITHDGTPVNTPDELIKAFQNG